MKKYWCIFISLILLAPCVWAQSFKRTAKNPGFFIPQGALQTNNKPEKLVPVDQMRFRGQQAPVVVEMQRQAQEKAQKEAEEKAKQAASEKKKQEDEIRQKLRQQELAKTQQEEKNIDNTKVAVNVEENQATNVTFTENKKLSPMEEARLKAKKIKSAQSKQTIALDDETKFAQIIEEYRSEVKAISEGRPLPNKRLIEVISDYKDIDHSI